MAALHPSQIIKYGGDFSNPALTTQPQRDLRDTASNFGLASVANKDLAGEVAPAVGRYLGHSITLPGNIAQGMLNTNF